MTSPIFFTSTALTLSLAATALAAGTPRYAARFADGTRIEGNDLADWHKPELAPKLDGQALLDPNRPLMWLLDRQRKPGSPPPAFVETISGDRLPGVAVGYRRSGETDVVQQFDCWLVRPEEALRPPQEPAQQVLRVDARFVRRVVWQRRPRERFEPGTVFFRDGRTVSYRKIRITEESIQLLLPEGTRSVYFQEIAELHLPADDFWERYVDEAAVLGPDSAARWMQVETTGGLIATTSLERFAAYAAGSEKIADQWVHGLQPAWSLDILWVPCDRIWVRRLFAAQQVPLTRIAFADDQLAANLAAAMWPVQLNRQVRGGPLRSGGREFGGGFGVQAPSLLRFPLAPWPAQLRADFGLDRLALRGGCVQARVLAGAADRRKIFESPVLVGSDQTLAVGPVGLPARDANNRDFWLEVDPAHANRPPGADPLNVRDTADWLDPQLEFDRGLWVEQTAKRLPLQVACWSGWEVQLGGNVAWPGRQREVRGGPGSFVRGVAAREQPVILKQTLPAGSSANWLLLLLSRLSSREVKPLVQVYLDDQLVLEREIPYRDTWRSDPEPVIVSLADHPAAGDGARRVEIRQAPVPAEVPVFWEGIAWTARLPMLREVFADEGQFVALDGQTVAAAAELVADSPYAGRAAVRLEPGQRYRLQLASAAAIREYPDWGQFRFLCLALRKTGGGRLGLELEHRDSARKPLRYDAGVGEPVESLAKRVWDRAIPEQWTLVTRDVFADFGEVDALSFTFSVPDGEAAFVDHVYFARGANDFQYLKTNP